MKKTLTTIIARWTVGAACLALVLWSLPGCSGDEDSHDEADHPHASADEAETHADNETESGAQEHDEAEGDHGHDEADGDHAHGHEFVEPKTFAVAVHMIQESMEAIEDALSENRLADIHADAEIIASVARLVGQLALAEGSGVSRDAVRDVNVAGRELASASDELHEASDEGDRPESQTDFDRMKTNVETLSQYAGPAGDHDDDDHSDSDHDH